jgi:hypothetical protein
MDKYLTKLPSSSTNSATAVLELEDPALIQQAKPFILGVLGATEKLNKQSIHDTIMNPILAEQGRMPSSLLLPSEGTSSTLLAIWAERFKVPCAEYECDWRTLGKRARAMRDSRIVKEATHLILFCGPKSDYYEKLAARELKKGRVIYTVNSTNQELEEWVLGS